MRACDRVLLGTEAFCCRFGMIYLCTKRKSEGQLHLCTQNNEGKKKKEEKTPLVELQPCRRMPQRVLAESC